MREVSCLVCGAKFLAQTSGKYCSDACRKIFYKAYSDSKYLEDTTTETCKQCGTEFQARRHQRNCGNCRRKHGKPKKTSHAQDVACKDCSTVYKTVVVSTVKKCCSSVVVRGHCPVCLHKRHSDRMLGDKNPMVKKWGRARKPLTKEEVSTLLSTKMLGDKNPMKNPRVVSRMIEASRRNGSYDNYPKGIDHANWRGNRRRAQTIRTRLYKEWTYPILERDKFSCVVCGSKKKLEVHHSGKSFREILSSALRGRPLDDLSDLDFEQLIQEVIETHKEVEGITLCYPCHKELDPLRH